MPEEMNWKKFLTDNVLHEVWHEPRITENSRCSCGRPYYIGTPYDHCNRRYDNELDMMKLYRAIHWEGNWTAFTVYSNNIWWQNCDRPYDTVEQAMADYNSYLLCFGDKDYESRCKMVAKFYGWEEEKK